MMAGDNDRYRAGEVAAELRALNKQLAEILKRLDQMSEWRADVNARLAVGNEKFRQIEEDVRGHGKAIRELRDTSRRALAYATGIGTAIGTFCAIVVSVVMN